MKEEQPKKHIAFYIGSLHKGGAERVFVNLADYFRGEGYGVTMVTQYQYPPSEEYALPEGVNRVLSDLAEGETTGSRFVNFCRRFRKLRRIWKREKPDLVLSCAGKNNFMTVATTMFTRTKAVVSVVGEAKEEYPGRLMPMLAGLLFPRAAGIVLQTERSRAFFSDRIRKKAVVLPNSLNPAFIRPRYTGPRDKEIVAVGRLDANKNHEMMIRAFAALQNRYPEYTLTIYGEGELRGRLQALAQELGVAERVSMPGMVADIARRIEKASLFLITSYSEGVSNALIEALATGLPVIATDVPSGGTQELMTDGVNGLIIPAGDAAALEKAMDRLLGDPAYAEKLGCEAAHIQERLAPEQVNRLWREYFEGICGGAPSKRSGPGTAVQAVLFAALFLVMFVGVSYMVRTNGDVKDRFSGFYAEKDNTVDVVMIGSSPVFPYYAAPKIWGETGIAMYPLSSNVQRPAAMKYLVQEAEKSQSPDLYIFEMRMFTMADEGLRENMAYTRGVTDNLRYSYLRYRTIQAMVPADQEEGRLSFYLDIMKYHTNWKMLLLPSEWANITYHKPHPLKGYTFKDEVGPQPMPDCGGAPGTTAIPADQEAYLYDLLDFLKAEGRDALFIVSPYGETLKEQQMYNYMEEIVTAQGYPFVNMNNYYDEIGIVFEEDFADYGSHTNAVGAEKCTAFLERYLEAHYSLAHRHDVEPDRDVTYASWDEAYRRWQARMETARETIRERIENEDYAVKEEEQQE